MQEIINQHSHSLEFKFLFEKVDEAKNTYNELFITSPENILPKSIAEIKRIVDFCNQQEDFITYTRS